MGVFERLQRAGVVAGGHALPGLAAHADVERLDVREPARARRLHARLRAGPAPRARVRSSRPCRDGAEHPVGHLPGGARLRELLPRPPPRLQGAHRRAARPAGRCRPAGRRAGLSPLLRQPGGSAPRDAARHRDPRRARPGDRRARAPGRRLPAPAGPSRTATTRPTSPRCAAWPVPGHARCTSGSSTTTTSRATAAASTPRAPWSRPSASPPSADGAAPIPARVEGLLASHRHAVEYLLRRG